MSIISGLEEDGREDGLSVGSLSKSEAAMGFLIWMFVDLSYHVDIYYEHHLGIIEMEETIQMDEIIPC